MLAPSNVRGKYGLIARKLESRTPAKHAVGYLPLVKDGEVLEITARMRAVMWGME